MTSERKKREDMHDMWLPPPPPETTGEKFKRKIKENPFVPIGMLATVGALGYGFYGFQTGNQRLQQVMMRTRVVAQGATVLCLVGGIAVAAIKSGSTK